jgi:tetratricopeptide (TPR) repeat protein
MNRLRTSLTMIARDEEHNLPDCLGPVRGLFDEVILFDTGSLDCTREVAADLGAKVFEMPWPDSFAAARNAALDRATGIWAFRLDADERLTPPDRDALAALLATLPETPDAFTVRCRHERADGPAIELDEVRLFPNRPDVRWVYRVHEQIEPGVREAGGTVRQSPVILRHVGYTDPALAQRKLSRNRRLLELDALDRPADPYVRFYLGWTLLDLREHAAAIPVLTEACRLAPPGFALLAHCHAALARAHLAGKRADLALHAIRTGRAVCPRDAELACLEAELLLRTGDRTGAAAIFGELLAGRFAEDPRPPGGGACGHRSRHGLACCLPMERAREREVLWREALALRPDFGPAWIGLGEMFAAQGRLTELARLTAEAEAARPDGTEGVVLRARRAAAAGDHRSARRELTRYCAEHPGAVLPRVVLAQTILLEGRDRPAAARAVAEVLALEPDNPEVARLAALLARWGG